MRVLSPRAAFSPLFLIAQSAFPDRLNVDPSFPLAIDSMSKRRQFLSLMGATLVGSMMLGGCMGNPPDKGGGAADTSTPSATADKGLETKTINLGFVPILEAAPLVVAVEKGYFAKHGLDVNLTKQASWPAARDNVVLGSAGGGIDGGQWQLPMPQMISEGAITDGKKVPMYILAMLMSQGNGIAASNNIKERQSHG